MTTNDEILKPLKKEKKKKKEINSHTKLNIKPVSLFYSVKTFTITEFVKYDKENHYKIHVRSNCLYCYVFYMV